jgi:formate C-acetyltransferase
MQDGLAAAKKLVFEEKKYTMAELIEALKTSWEGREEMRMDFVRAPKWGNDDDYADDIMKRVFNSLFNEIDDRPNTKGGRYHIDMLPTTCHIYFGSITGATPDGRLSGAPLSEGISPVQGADRNGPTAVIKSCGKMDQIRTGGTLLNMKFMPKVLQGEEGLDKLAKLVRTYFRYDAHHIQFNVVDIETLRDAQEHPENYRDLIVRVAGYSDYFCDIGLDLQEEIISRTAQEEV